MPRILVIEDDAAARGAALDVLRAHGLDAVAADTTAATALIGNREFEVVLAAGARPRPGEPAIAHQTLVCLPSPLAADDLLAALAELEQRGAIRRALDDADATLARGDAHLGGDLATIIGASPAIRRALATSIAIAASDAPVLLTGESGTGKELLARVIHAHSARHTRPLVAVNCAAFPEHLLEAELFGYVRGAFTGADRRRDGCFLAADGGTLFLDEIDNLSAAAQAKLLRVVQDGRFHPVGSDAPIEVDVRLVSATNANLRAAVDAGRFREDLYYRIKVLDLELPPLRERAGDLPLLVAHFLRKHAPAGVRPSLTPRAWAALGGHAFPGNVRELEHALQRALVLARGSEIGIEHLPSEIGAGDRAACADNDGADGEPTLRPLWEAVREFEYAYVAHALELAHGNKTLAARMLGVSRKHLWEKLRRLSTAKPYGTDPEPTRR